MAGGAVAEARVGHVVGSGRRLNPITLPSEFTRSGVALQAKRENRRPPKKPGVHRPVRHVTRRAAVHPHRRVLKGEGPPLVDVALQARFLVAQARFHHFWPLPRCPSGGLRPVGVMAIGALDNAFVDPVLDGHRELRPNTGVTAVAEISLLTGQQGLHRLRLVNRVALVAGHLRESVRRTTNLHSPQTLRVATQAIRQDLAGRQSRKRDNPALVALSRNVFAARSMATLAPRRLGRGPACLHRLGVRILIEIHQYVRMARPAGRAAHVLWCGGGRTSQREKQ